MLAHIQRDAKHNTVTQYWANISPDLGQRLVFAWTAPARADRGKPACPHVGLLYVVL